MAKQKTNSVCADGFAGVWHELPNGCPLVWQALPILTSLFRTATGSAICHLAGREENVMKLVDILQWI